jgi:ribose/xylose/arabinose/galactoside ABC-type transport system permease subunit
MGKYGLWLIWRMFMGLLYLMVIIGVLGILYGLFSLHEPLTVENYGPFIVTLVSGVFCLSIIRLFRRSRQRKRDTAASLQRVMSYLKELQDMARNGTPIEQRWAKDQLRKHFPSLSSF